MPPPLLKTKSVTHGWLCQIRQKNGKGPVQTGCALVAGGGAGPFDLVFIDADKESTAEYLAWALRLTKPGSLILIDNVVRNGAVSDPGSSDPDVQGVRRALIALAGDSLVVATAVQTVGSKGYDGLAIALVTAE